MGKVFEHITDELREFIQRQHLFFVATAPLNTDGHINVSPKGLDCLRVLSPSRVAYLDLTGSGNETSAHIEENGRITVMFCAFEGAPRILRLYGTGSVILPESAEWGELSPLFPAYAGARQIIAVEVTRVQTACGFAVPLFAYTGERETLLNWAETKGADGLSAYQQQKNMESIDGLPTPLAARYNSDSSNSGIT